MKQVDILVRMRDLRPGYGGIMDDAMAEIEWLRKLVAAPAQPAPQQHLCILRDLAIAADAAELMLRPYYPGEAASLHAKIKAAKEITDTSICKTCWGHGWVDDDKGGHTCANCAAQPPAAPVETGAIEDLISTFKQMRGYPDGDENDPCFDLCGMPCCDEFGCLHQKVRLAREALAHQRSSAGNGVDVEAIKRWFNSLPGESLSQTHWLALLAILDQPQPPSKTPADDLVSQIEERFPNWRSFRDLVDCIDCTLHQLRTETQP